MSTAEMESSAKTGLSIKKLLQRNKDVIISKVFKTDNSGYFRDRNIWNLAIEGSLKESMANTLGYVYGSKGYSE